MSLSNQEFKEILLYPIQDKDWLSKVCLQVAVIFFLCFFLVGFPLLFGYMIRCTQKAIARDSTLPGWNEWGLYWRLGWKVIAACVLFGLPIFFVVVLFLLVFGLVLALQGYYGIGEELFGLIAVLGMLMYLVILCYSVVMMCIQPAYFSAIAVGNTVLESVNLKRLWPYVKANVLTILVGVAIAYLGGLIASVGMFMLFLGLFFTYGYGVAVSGYTFGVIYRNSPVKF